METTSDFDTAYAAFKKARASEKAAWILLGRCLSVFEDVKNPSITTDEQITRINELTTLIKSEAKAHS